MITLLQFDFPFDGPWGEAMSHALQELANDIAQEDGLLWKIWTENQDERRAGGIYLFLDPALAEHYRQKHSERLAAFGINGVAARTFAVNGPLSIQTRAPL